MSVSTYLATRASNAVLSTTERNSVGTSISTLQTRLDSWFVDKLTTHFKFGSFTRDTILPRSMDTQSDIDYMVVFKEGGYQPQTYLDRLKKFVEARYQTSELYQSSPTIVLELNHIKFELVPALDATFGTGYRIPRAAGGWQDTNPNDFNAKLTAKNVAEGHCLKPAIRLAKFWNANDGYVFNSYLLEKWIVDQQYWSCGNVRDYLFAIFENLALPTDAQWRKDKVQRAKDIVAQVKKYERDKMPVNAELEVKKLIPA
jgi:hypothetical protein